MGLTFDFLWAFASLLRYVVPLLGGLALIIAALSALVGHWERWTLADSLYFGFITALTVGYGDFRPSRRASKIIAVLIGLLGLVTTGILIAVSVEAASVAFQRHG